MEYPMKGRPKIACPNCGARLLNAADKSVKNSTVPKYLNARKSMITLSFARNASDISVSSSKKVLDTCHDSR